MLPSLYCFSWVHSLSVTDGNIGVLYASTLCSSDSKTTIEAAVSALLKSSENDDGKLLYSLYYEQEQQSSDSTTSVTSIDLAFNDEILDAVEGQWKSIMSDENGVLEGQFMQFEDRKGQNDDEEDDEGFWAVIDKVYGVYWVKLVDYVMKLELR